jgi:hypothetical protein
MRPSEFSEKGIVYALRQTEPVTLHRKYLSAAGIGAQIFHVWKK